MIHTMHDTNKLDAARALSEAAARLIESGTQSSFSRHNLECALAGIQGALSHLGLSGLSLNDNPYTIAKSLEEPVGHHGPAEETCGMCNGTGEGATEHYYCRFCKGHGAVPVEQVNY